MRAVLLLLHKDLLRRRRAPLGVLVMLAFPLIFSAMLAFAFGGSETGLPAAKLLLYDEDDGLVGGLIANALSSEQLNDYLDVIAVGEEGVQMMADGEASALLRIPSGTTLQLFEGQPIVLEMIRNPTQGILPEIAEQVIATLTDVLSVAARVLHREAEGLEIDLLDLDNLDDQAFARLVIRIRRLVQVGNEFLDEPLLSLTVVMLDDEGNDPAEVASGEQTADDTIDEDDADDDSGGGDDQRLLVFLFVLPGVSVYALFIIGDQMMRDVLAEAQMGTLRRQLSAPIDARQVIAGKVLLSGVVAGLALLILAAIAFFLADTAVSLTGFVALSLALLLAVSGLSAAIYGVVRDEQQGSTLSSLLYLVLAFAGGSFLPLDNLPAAVQRIAPVSPFYWGTRGFQDLLDGGGLPEVATAVLILGVLGTVLLLFGAWRLKRKVLRGDI